MFRSICFKCYTCDHNVLCTFKDDSPSHQPEYEVITVFKLTFHQIWSYISLALIVGVEHCTLVRKDFFLLSDFLHVERGQVPQFQLEYKINVFSKSSSWKSSGSWILSILHSDIFDEYCKVQKIRFKKMGQVVLFSFPHCIIPIT